GGRRVPKGGDGGGHRAPPLDVPTRMTLRFFVPSGLTVLSVLSVLAVLSVLFAFFIFFIFFIGTHLTPFGSTFGNTGISFPRVGQTGGCRQGARGRIRAHAHPGGARPGAGFTVCEAGG
ncbi:hypothetical protein, partial [Streptomyces clavuligerus]|uniref:hypothetical protein n=1 Tax=Streptomyces clavuligerus TaxID=1901 RepID=UPI001E31CA95